MTNQLHIKGLEASVAALMQQVAELEAENTRLQEALKRREADLYQVEANLAECIDRVIELEAKSASLKKQCESLSNSRKAFNQENTRLRNDIETRERERLYNHTCYMELDKAHNERRAERNEARYWARYWKRRWQWRGVTGLEYKISDNQDADHEK